MGFPRRQVLKSAVACAAAMAGMPVGNVLAGSSPRNTLAASQVEGLKGLRMAVTTDDMALVKGLPHSPGYDPIMTARAFVKAFANHKIRGVYQFSNAVPFVDAPSLLEALDIWVDAGHFVGNHGYHHAPLSEMLSVDYAHDIERAEKVFKRYIDAAPRRYFRYAAYQLGNTECKVNNMFGHLARLNYVPAPVTVGFDDAMFIMAHLRTTKYGTKSDMEWLRNQYIECAVEELGTAAINAKKVFNRSPAHIWLIHGTSIAADCIDRILGRFQEEGVQFISLDEAMQDPMNTIPPPLVTTTFMFHVQMWAIAMGTPVDFPHPAIFDEVETLYPRRGEMTADMFERARSRIDAKWTPAGTPADQDC